MEKETKQLIEELISKVEENGEDNIISMLIRILSSSEESNQIFDNEMTVYGDSKERLLHIFNNKQINFQKDFAVGITFGGLPEIVVEKENYAFREFVLTTFAFYNQIEKEFAEKNIGFSVHRTGHMLNMIGVFPKKNRDDFVKVYLEPLHKLIEEKYQVKLCIGVGMIAEEKMQLYNSYQTAKFAHELYFFRQQSIIEFQKIEKRFVSARDDYDTYMEDTFHAILIKSPDALNKIERMVDVIAEIHFGNWQAVLMRIMVFTGDLTSKLQKYNLFRGDFYQVQDELQVKILNCKTLKQAKTHIHDYYANFLPYIYDRDRVSSKITVEKVKRYIQDNFMEELSIKTLSEVACVSPNYFSHMFKNEVGLNYKDYLTSIRMEKAIDMILNTDYPLYRVAETVGYNNTRTFVDAFKKVYGDSPTKYKKKIKAENSRK